MKNLKVYKASAGSGKTFTLTVEYIRLVILNPDDYRHILAVTFTNKATNEMKERILFTLDKLSRHDPDAAGYLKNIKDGLPEEYDDNLIASRARMALCNILHDYSRFRIETIDSFFQSIIRDLAHELSLTASLKVDLHQEEVLSDAVRDIIENLHTKSNALYAAIFEFIEEKIEESRNWKIDKDIEEFGKNIFNEVFLSKEKELSEIFRDSKFFGNYKKRLQDIRKEKEGEIQDIVSRFFVLCHRLGCNSADHFTQKARGPYKYFGNLHNKDYSDPNSYTRKCIDGDMPFAKDGIVAEHDDEFRSLFSQAETLVCRNRKVINTVSLIFRHINQMRLLNAVNTKVRELNNDANRFLLADTAHFLHSLINESDIPFIYEKSGTRFNHIMIDEFQDTSTLQWENFKPLLKNSIDAGKMCLIVGDVKQSIYRWRNTDWGTLNNIGSDRDFKTDISIQTLKTNHRSSERVIKFNNALFSNIRKDTEYEDAKIAYADVEQKVSDKHLGEGFVQMELLPADDYTENTLRRVRELIEDLISSGIRKEDITLLLRTKKEISNISNHFAKECPQLKIVSEEAYRLESSQAINIIVHALEYIANPDDRLSLATLILHTHAGKSPQELSDLLTLPAQEMKALLPPAFVESVTELALTPLYELCHIIYQQFSLQNIPEQDAYLMSFFDNVSNYVSSENIDINRFLTYWKDTLHKTTIPSGSIDGITAMTIHKSKGLEFHTVICPFFSWNTSGRHDNLIWCEPKGEPFSELPLTAISFDKKAEESIFSTDYRTETMKNTVDNLNLLYVAFTRAEKNLFILTGGQNGTNVKSILLNNLPELMTKADDSDVYTYGELVPSPRLVSLSPPTSFPSLSHLVPFIEQKSNVTFRQSNKSVQFIGTIGDSIKEYDQHKYINQGLTIHRFFELIHTLSDKEHAISQLEDEGRFEDEKSKAEAVSLIDDALSDPRIADWFNPRWKEFNECTILARDADGNHIEKRPDRVITDGNETIVIDYKTGAPSDEHDRQVRTYMHLLTTMGYPHVRGYLWYIRRGEILALPE